MIGKTIFNKFIYIIGIWSISWSQNQGDIHLVELMETKTAAEIISELESDFSEFDLPLNIFYDV